MKTVKDSFSLGLAVVVSRAILMTREGVLAATLGPSAYGVWVQATTILNYALHSPLGYQNVLSLDAPYHFARKDAHAASMIARAALTVTVVMAFAAGLAQLLAWQLIDDLDRPALVPMLVLTVVLLQQINGWQSILLRAEQRFVAYAAGLVGISAIGLVVAAVTVPLAGVEAAIVSQGVALLVVSLFWRNRVKSYFVPIGAEVFRSIARLWSRAFPLFMGSALAFLLVSSDRLYVIFVYSKEEAGLYGLAFILVQSVQVVASPVVNVFSNRMMRDYGVSGTPIALIPYLLLFTLLLPISLSVFLGVLNVVVSSFVEVWFGQYVPSLGLLAVLSCGVAFVFVATGVQALLVAVGEERLVMRGNAVLAAAQLLLYFACFLLDVDLKSFVWFVVLFHAIYSLCFLLLIHRSPRCNVLRIGVYIGKIYAPIVFCVLGVYLLVDLRLEGIPEWIVVASKVSLLVLAAGCFIFRWSRVLRLLAADSSCSENIEGVIVTRNAT